MCDTLIVRLWHCSVVWYCLFLYQCGSSLLLDNLITRTNVAVLCCLILSVLIPMLYCFFCLLLWMLVPMLQWSVVWYYQWPYQCGSALMCHTVIEILWQCSVVWYCKCLNQSGSVLFFYIVRDCTNVAVLRFVILSVAIPMWQCSVVWYSQCKNVAMFCCVILSVRVTMWQCSVVRYS